MAHIQYNGRTIKTIGELPVEGTTASEFALTCTDLTEITLSDYAGMNIVLNIFPSIDTPICAESVKQFNLVASKLPNTVVLCVSADLPFAQKRFCQAHQLDNVIPVSEFRHSLFGDSYGLRIVEGPLQGLLARAVIVIDPQEKIIHTQLVADLADEPDYQLVIERLH